MKNWYNKEMLDSFKRLVDSGHKTQQDYDDLEKLMKTFNLDDETIVDKTIECFLSIKQGDEVSYSQLLSKCLSLNALAFFDLKDLFKLYDCFIKECKKRKIKIGYHEYGGAVGLPFNLGFWRAGLLTKKIVYNLFYGCWSRTPGELSRIYVIFEKHKITYCSVTIDDFSHKDNCFIKVAYNPTKECNHKSANILDEYDFDKICACAEFIALNHNNNFCVYDAIPASIVIFDDKKEKRIIRGLSFDETKPLDLIVEQFMPNSFKKAIE